jgi:hypothetical protein
MSYCWSTEELKPYTQSNTPVPADLEPALATHLGHLSSTIFASDGEILELETQLALKKAAKSCLSDEQTADLSFGSPIRKIPSELLSLVFGHVLGTKAFRREQYLDYVHLRGTCKIWRVVVEETPYISSGLELNLDNIDYHDPRRHAQAVWGDEHLMWMLTPWLSIVARSPRYHLVFKGEGTSLHQKNIKPILQHFLLTQPSPATLTIDSSRTTGTLFKLDPTFPDLESLKITHNVPSPYDGDIFEITAVFPRLNTLIAECDLFIPRPPPLFKQKVLQKLHLEDVTGSATFFPHLLQSLPNLKELRLASVEEATFPEPSAQLFESPSLEILILAGQDLFAFLQGTSFPSLRLLCLHGMHLDCPETLVKRCIPQFFRGHRGHLGQLTISFRRVMHPGIIKAIIDHVPPRTRLHFDSEAHAQQRVTVSIQSDHVDEIFCTQNTLKLGWLKREYCRNTTTQPITIYLPSSTATVHEEELGSGELRAWGYQLETRPKDVLDSMIRSSIPPTDLHWF